MLFVAGERLRNDLLIHNTHMFPIFTILPVVTDCYSVQEGTPSTQVGREYTITVPTVTVPGASTTLPIKAEAGTETTPPTSASLSPTSSPPASDDAENAFTSTSSNGRGVVPAAVVPTNFHNWEQP
jgi:hypothetical protein